MSSTLTPLLPTLDALGTWLLSRGFRRPRCTVLHHTFSPDSTQYKGRETIVAIRKYHMEERRWSDIGANAYACPDGFVYTGRGLDYENWSHALISRTRPDEEAQALSSGNRQYFNRWGFGVETVANFDREDPRRGSAARSLECAMQTLAVVHAVFSLPASRMFLHRDVADKSCPGTRLSRHILRADLDRRLQLPTVEVVMAPDMIPLACHPTLEGGTVRVDLRPVWQRMGGTLDYQPGPPERIVLHLPASGSQ